MPKMVKQVKSAEFENSIDPYPIFFESDNFSGCSSIVIVATSSVTISLQQKEQALTALQAGHKRLLYLTIK